MIDIKGFKNYKVTKSGKVFKLSGGKLREVKPYDNGQGYKQVKLYKGGQRYTKNIHRLVMKEPRLDVDHIDENKGNNSSDNLQELSHSDNIRKSFKK